MKRYFITGTDTDVGKTRVAGLLVDYFVQQQKNTLVFKPVAAGAEVINGRLENDDARYLLSKSNMKQTYEEVNPFCFQQPIAPHIAAKNQGVDISLAQLSSRLSIDNSHADVVFIEGAGGWLVPLNDKETFADIAALFKTEIILVVGMKLGCINHALLTVNNILAMGLTLKGWVANYIDPHMDAQNDNLESLKARINAPHLLSVPYSAEFDIDALDCQALTSLL